MKKSLLILLISGLMILTSCVSTNQSQKEKDINTYKSSSENVESEKVNLNETSVPISVVMALKDTENEFLGVVDSSHTVNGFVVWDCKDYLDEKEILFQIGYYEIVNEETNKKVAIGFIVFDEPFIKNVYWKEGSPLPGMILSEKDIPKGKILSPSGVASEATTVIFNKEGLDYTWSWYNPRIDKSSYKILLQPDGTVLYYDFTNIPYGQSAKPKSVLKGSKHVINGKSVCDDPIPIFFSK